MTFILALGLIFTAFMHAEVSIPPAADKGAVIFIYHSGKAVMHETRHSNLNQSTSAEITFTEFPNSLTGEEVMIISNSFTAHSTYISHLPVNERQLLLHFEGKKIGLAKILDTGELSKPIPATLLSYGNGQAVYGLEDQVVVNPNGMQPVFPYIPDELTELPNVISVGESIEGNAEFLLSYIIDGLTWTASYHLQLSDSNMLSLSGNYLLNNQTSDTFEKTNVFLVSANNTSASPHPPPLPKREMDFSTAFKPSEPSTPEMRDVEDFEIYQIKNFQNLPKKTTVQASLLPKIEIEFEKEYVVAHLARVRYRQRNHNKSEDESWESASLQLNIKTSETIEQHLPPGTLNIYKKVDGYDALIGEKSVETISKGNNIRVDLKKTQDILYQIKHTNQQENEDSRTVTITGKFKNLKNDPIQVKWIEYSVSPFTISESSVEFKMTDILNAETNLNIPAGETIEEIITLYFKKNK